MAIDSYLTTNKLKKSGKILENLVKIYQKYQDSQDPDHIDIDGTLAYLLDLGIESDDPRALVLAYYLQAPSIGVFNKNSFLSQWQQQKVTNLLEMKSFIDKIYKIIVTNDTNHSITINDQLINFENFYNFTFDFLMVNENQKLLDLATAVDYWKLLLPLLSQDEHVLTRFNQWYDFISQEYKRSISKDSWSMIYLFIQDILMKDPINFSGYDEMAAWPSVIDEYIEYLRENNLLHS